MLVHQEILIHFHTVEEVGEKAGSGIIAHGMLIMGMVAQGVTTWIPRKHIRKSESSFSKNDVSRRRN